jgi:hypothetical protein
MSGIAAEISHGLTFIPGLRTHLNSTISARYHNWNAGKASGVKIFLNK